MKREEGYYWIKIEQSDPWQVAEWDGKAWWVCGSESWIHDTEISIVAEKAVKKIEDTPEK